MKMNINLDPKVLTQEQCEELKEIAESREFIASVRVPNGGSRGDINTFIENLNMYLKNGMELDGIYFDFVVSRRHVRAMLMADMVYGEELRHVEVEPAKKMPSR